MPANDLEAARAYLRALDLTYIAEAMCSDYYPLPRWTPQDAAHCLQLYKNFLWLHKIHPGTPFVPTREIDEFWHHHILYTKNYLRDCQQIFGHYLHHQPAKPGENDGELADHYARTKELYLLEFKQPLSLIIDLSATTA